jgi:activator of HSP90 ATPase
MKRICIAVLSLTLLTGGALSCRKTSKGKMANEWIVTGYNSDYLSTNLGGDVYEASTVLSGNVLKEISTGSLYGSVTNSERSSSVNEWTYTIEKNGNWSSLQNTTQTSLDSSFDATTQEMKTFMVTNNRIFAYSGVWNFSGKSKAETFKKNERVIFNTLTRDYKRTKTIEGESPILSTSVNTYLAGESNVTYTVVESKKNELKLREDSERTAVYDDNSDNSYNSNFISTVTLTQK